MTRMNRRNFLAASTATLCSAVCSRIAAASPLGLPIGLQLYSVRDLLAKDYEGTLRAVADLGYREVEAAGFYHHSPEQVHSAMKAAGLSCVSAHHSSADLSKNFDEIVAYAQALGLQYIICSFPGFKDPARSVDHSIAARAKSFSLDDYRWNADRFNEWGRKVKAAGMQFGYHNHTMEFARQDGVIPLDEMIRLTDPALVTFELDCGWVLVGGGDPVDYLHRFPTRISMLHVKDFKQTVHAAAGNEPPPAAELGRGTLDFRPVFQAAKAGQIRHYFVEQEAFNLPPLESLKIDEEYMRTLNV